MRDATEYSERRRAIPPAVYNVRRLKEMPKPTLVPISNNNLNALPAITHGQQNLRNRAVSQTPAQSQSLSTVGMIPPASDPQIRRQNASMALLASASATPTTHNTQMASIQITPLRDITNNTSTIQSQNISDSPHTQISRNTSNVSSTSATPNVCSTQRNSENHSPASSQDMNILIF